ncbi:Mu transposase C-terminal domain-containing protein [Rhodovastum atsumiense]|uniref:DDE-type integrase/transposase/recombinase n=1 Tax=Rhodovastum atsumiense TaxID=504468 RepID=A0A5M6IJ51_9PROT|nr:Mu transposase C-terminal domain-containing protein [Rhodovastum atsumiense]KAA5608271.1 DDE-type integrase/transposase/recombinase [Rhodovastum atsumiense]
MSDRSSLPSASDEVWAEAARREAVIRPLAQAPRLTRAVVTTAAHVLDLSIPHVYRLIQAFRRRPETASLLLSQPGPAKGRRRLDPAVEARIEAALARVYLQPERPTLRYLFVQVRQDCQAAGLTSPSMNALRARVSARSLRERVRAREGSAAADRFRQVTGGLRTERPLQVVQIDHTKVDIMLVDDVMRACIGRPWLTLVLDVHTRMVAGFLLSLDPPCAASVALAVSHAVLPKAAWLADRDIALAWPVHGLPETIHVDNGAEFHAHAFERGCQRHGIRIEYRPPATPRFGGHIERLMGTLMERVHALPGTTFSSVAARGAYASEAEAVLTLQEFERLLALEVLGPYHNEVHSGLGRSPAAAWVAAQATTPLRQASDEPALRLDFLPFEERVIRRDGVRLFNILYQDGALAHLVDRDVGRLRVKYDPRDLSAVFVELPTGGHVRVPYADLGRPAITLWEHREAVRRLHAEGRRGVDEPAIFAAIAEQRHILEDAARRSKAARRAVARTGLAASAAVAAPNQPPHPPAALAEDDEARVPMPPEGEGSGVEFW